MILPTVDELRGLLAGRRWFAGGEPGEVSVLDAWEWPAGVTGLVVDAGDARWLLPVESQDGVVVDALDRAESVLAIASLVDRPFERARPMGVEQSNTSWVLDERVVIKFLRRLEAGPNRDREMTEALSGHPFVAPTIGSLGHEGVDVAVLSGYLADAVDAWSLATTDDVDAAALGRLVADLHVALAGAFGVESVRGRDLVERFAAQRERTAGAHRLTIGDGPELPSTEDLPAIRVHGDLHLGQLLWCDERWYVIDFDGEPARPADERSAPTSPLHDVAGMVRSFAYAEAVRVEPGWARPRVADFTDAYFGSAGIDALLPDDAAAWLHAFVLDKATYELDYELRHRPDWAHIPAAAVAELTGS